MRSTVVQGTANGATVRRTRGAPAAPRFGRAMRTNRGCFVPRAGGRARDAACVPRVETNHGWRAGRQRTDGLRRESRCAGEGQRALEFSHGIRIGKKCITPNV